MKYNWQNTALADAARDFIIESLRLLRTIRSDTLPAMPVETVSFPAEGGVRSSTSFQIDYHLTIIQEWDKLERLPGYSSFLKELRADGIAKQQLNTQIWIEYEAARGYSEQDFATLILVDLLRSRGITEFESEAFAKSYGRFEEFVFSKSLRFRTLVPLSNFESKIEPVDLGSGMSIVPVSEEEFNQINELPSVSLFSAFSFGFPKYGVRIDYERKKTTDELWRQALRKPDPVRDQLDKIISALRLLKDGRFGPAMICAFNLTLGVVAHSQILGDRTAVYAENPYVLEQQDIPKLHSFWQKFRHIDFDTEPIIALSMKRLNYAQERGLLEDKLIDLMIGFEALFMRQSEKHELSYHLAIRTAILLGSDQESKKEIFDTMRAGYELRSKIVHGEIISQVKIGTGELSVMELMSRLEKYLRASIMKFLERSKGKSIDGFIAELDHKIFN